MRIPRPFLVLTTLLLLAAPRVSAQDTFETLSGNKYMGTILSNDGTTVEIQTTEGATMKVPIAQLTHETQYRIKRDQAGNDARAHLDLADWCVGNILYKQARAEFRKALELGPAMEEEINTRFAKARTTAANEALERGKKLMATNQKQEARYIFSKLVQELPLETASTEAARLLAEETTQRKADALKRSTPAAPTTPAEGATTATRQDGSPFSEATRTLFAPVIAAYHEMLDQNQAGLTKGGSAGLKEFEKALKAGEKLKKSLDKLRAAEANDAEVAEAMTLADAKLEEAIVDVRINMSDSYMLRTSYDQASEVVRQGLAEYPEHPRLRSAMNRVTSASSDNDGGWVLGGGRRG